MEKVLQNELISLSETESKPLDHIYDDTFLSDETTMIHQGSTSGGYAYHVFVKAAKELFSQQVTDVEFKVLRSVLSREM